jgi:hypothetical protein
MEHDFKNGGKPNPSFIFDHEILTFIRWDLSGTCNTSVLTRSSCTARAMTRQIYVMNTLFRYDLKKKNPEVSCHGTRCHVIKFSLLKAVNAAHRSKFMVRHQRFLSYCKLNSSNLIGSLAVIMRLYYLPVAGIIGHVILL